MEIDIWKEIYPLLKEEDKSIFEQHKDYPAFARYILWEGAIVNYKKCLINLSDRIKEFDKYKDYLIGSYHAIESLRGTPEYKTMIEEVRKFNTITFNLCDNLNVAKTKEYKEYKKWEQYRLERGF